MEVEVELKILVELVAMLEDIIMDHLVLLFKVEMEAPVEVVDIMVVEEVFL